MTSKQPQKIIQIHMGHPVCIIYDKEERPSLQLNLHETNLLFQYLSHHLTWHCSSIYEDLHRFAQIKTQNCFCYCFWTILGAQLIKLFTEAITKTVLRSNLCKSSKILKQYDVKWWLNYRKYGSVSYSFSFTWNR